MRLSSCGVSPPQSWMKEHEPHLAGFRHVGQYFQSLSLLQDIVGPRHCWPQTFFQNFFHVVSVCSSSLVRRHVQVSESIKPVRPQTITFRRSSTVTIGWTSSLFRPKCGQFVILGDKNSSNGDTSQENPPHQSSQYFMHLAQCNARLHLWSA